MKLFSSRSSHAANNARSARKATALVIAIALIVVMVVGGSVAWIVHQTKPVINKFTPASSGITIVEEVENNYKTEIAVNNTGDIDVYVRVSLVANIVDENGNITSGADVPDFALNETNWFKGTDGYYYYKTPLPAGKVTESLLANGSKMELSENMQVTVLAQSMQTTPTNAVTDAWSVVVGNDGTLSSK